MSTSRTNSNKDDAPGRLQSCSLRKNCCLSHRVKHRSRTRKEMKHTHRIARRRRQSQSRSMYLRYWHLEKGIVELHDRSSMSAGVITEGGLRAQSRTCGNVISMKKGPHSFVYPVSQMVTRTVCFRRSSTSGGRSGKPQSPFATLLRYPYRPCPRKEKSRGISERTRHVAQTPRHSPVQYR